jgi:tRNA modification GTPase
MMNIANTICAPATSVGSGAVSVIRVSGPDALAVADRVVRFRQGSCASSPGYTLKFGTVPDVDDVLVSVFRAPHSYTGEDSVEISCHASPFVVERLMQLLCEAGAVPAEPGEFTRRAFANGKMDLAQAEAVADLIASDNEASHRVAIHQLKGGISSELQVLRSQLLDVTSLMELELDFSEEEVEFADRNQLISLLDSAISHIKKLTESFRLGNAIRRGVPVAIVGATNTGKSTLLNALLGEDRAIVSPVAGTTRDTVEEVFNIDGTTFRLIDTAGIRETSDEIETIGIDRTFEKLMLADSIIAVFDVNSPVGTLCSELRNILSRVNLKTQQLVIVLNKVDLLEGFDEALESLASCSVLEPYEGQNPAILWVNKIVIEFNNIVLFTDNKIDIVVASAKSGFNLEKLSRALSDHQIARISDAGTATLVTNARHFNALCAASRALSLARSGIASRTPSDLVSQDLREALYHLGTITGEITTDEVLGNIFRNFCIGK